MFVLSLTAEANESSAIKYYIDMKQATQVPSGRRMNGVLEQMDDEDSLVIVAHGDSESIGTKSEANSYTPKKLYDSLNTTIPAKKQINIHIAACDTAVYAATLQGLFNRNENYDGHITVTGQTGDFKLSINYNP